MVRADQPVANGIRTDHPIPNLPFVDDTHIPIEDPKAVAAVGRHRGTGTWGRYDEDTSTGERAAFTTDPKNHKFAWVVRYHPEHGRAVVLYRSADATEAYSVWFRDRTMLTRLGGYWWNGTTWYRPAQVLSWASERHVRREVRHPVTITAADLLDSRCNDQLGGLAKILNFEPQDGVATTQWRHDLAMWAKHRAAHPDALPLDQCVVSVNAPELSEGSLVGVEEFAEVAGIAPSTLRAYLARGEADLPVPQAIDGGRKRWARPVVQDWVECRQRDTSNVASLLTGDVEDTLPPGLTRLWKLLTKELFQNLWGQPASRRRWARQHRTEQAVQAAAEEAAWVAALHLDSEVPFTDLSAVIEDAVVWQLDQYRGELGHSDSISLMPQVGRVLGWFIDHQPSLAPALFGNIVREAEKLNIAPKATRKSIADAVEFHGGIDYKERLQDFVEAVLPPLS